MGGKRLKILVVEDNEATRRLIELSLEGRDYEVRAVSGAHHALLYAEIEAPDLILLDINLEGIVDGWEVLRRLREIEKTASIPVIIASANGDTASLRRAREAGVADYVTKPCDVNEFLKRVERTLASRSMTADGEMSGESI